MAGQWKRSINMYININGEQVKNDIKSIRGELQHAINAQNKMTIGSKEYVQATQKIKQLSGILREHKEQIGQMQTPLQKVTAFAKGLLPAFSFTALASGAKMAFDKIVTGTDAMADRWEFSVAGMKNGLDYFWKSLSSGDWSGFYTNMREAIKVGREYAEMIDTVEDQTRGLSMVESDARGKELQLEEAVKNKMLSRSERIRAGEERIQLEQDLSNKRTKIAAEGLDAEILIASQRTGLSREQLLQITKDIDSESRARAEAYNQQLAQYEGLKTQNVSTITSPTTGASYSVKLPETGEMKKLRAEIEATPASVKAYAGALTQYGTLTSEMMDRIASAYVRKNEAENSARENVKKTITTVNSLLAGQEENGEKLEDLSIKRKKEAADKALELLDKANNERTTRLIGQYQKEGWTDERFKTESLAAEQAYLLQKKALLMSFGQSTVDIDEQINQKQIESQRQFNEAIEQLYKEMNNQQVQDQEANDEAVAAKIEFTNNAIDQSREILKDQKDTKEKERQILEEREQNYLNFALTIGQSMGQLMNDQEASFSDYLKSILVMSLDALHQFFLLKKAEVLIDSAAGAATGRFWKIAGAVVAVAAMEAAYQGIRGALTKKGSNTETKGHAAGGYAYEEQYIVSEGNKPEWIAPNWMLENPNLSRIIGALENYRKNPVSLTAGAFNSVKNSNNSILNASSLNTTPLARVSSNFEQLENNKQLTDAINNMNAVAALLLKNGVQMDIVTIKKKLDWYNDIVLQSGFSGYKK